MNAWKTTALLALALPAAALAQGQNPLSGPLDAARRAAQLESEPSREMKAADEQLAEPPPSEPAAEGKEPGAVDLQKAAERLEGQAGTQQAPAEAAGQAAAAAAPPDTYTVKPGDTLWDLSGRFLNNPWYWPKVWSYNPEISNPHWIYPGNVVRFYPAPEEAPTRVEPMAEAPPPPEEGAPEAPRELEDLSRASLRGPSPLADEDMVAVVGPYKIGETRARRILVRHESFITPHELEQSGEIRAAFEERMLLSALDKAYARFQLPAPVKIGESYVVYRTEGPVYHPRTGELLGYKSKIIGAARVTAVDEKVATLLITSSSDTIERGDHLGPWSDKLVRRVAPRPNQQRLDGTIVATETAGISDIGEYQMVYVDRGKADGVEEGNTFSVLRSGDPYNQDPMKSTWDPNLPVEVIGTLLVVDARERASAAVVSRSFREFFVGDRVEMRPAAAKAGSGGS